MQKIILLIVSIYFISFNAAAQEYCIPGRFDTTNVFSTTDIDSVILQFGQNTSWTGSTVNLWMTIYYPDTAVDPLAKRPFVMLVHGGSFTHGSRYDLINEVKYFSAKGYVCATIDYRMGWTAGYAQECNGDNDMHINAVYRAVQDCKAALRFVSANAAAYRIDSAQMFIGGTSSGALAAMAVSFISQNVFNVMKPGISNLLGPLDNADNTLTDPYLIKGILSYKGDIWDTSVINSSNVIPTIFLQGTADPYYPYYSGYAFSCTEYFILEGSGSLSTRFRNLGICYELNCKVNGNHGDIYPAAYTLGRRALFMKSLLCDECNQLIVQDQIVIDDNIITTIDDRELNDNEFNVYPNPVADYLTITGPEKTSTEIINPKGQIIRNMKSSEKETTIDLTNLSKGIYIIRLISDYEILTKKFIKE